MESHKQYLSLYTDNRSLIERVSPAPMNGCRQEAVRLLDLCGLPSQKEERYKYTPAEPAFAPDYGVNLRRVMPRVNAYETFKCNVPNLSTSLFFVVNDMPVPAPDSSRALLPDGVIVDSFVNVCKNHPGLLDKYYNRAASEDRDFRHGHDGVTLLNTLLAQDGMLVYIPEGVRLKTPIQIVNVASANLDMMSVRRVLVVAGKEAHGSVLFCDHSEGEHKYLITQVIEAYAEEGARLNLYSIEESHDKTTRFSTLYAEQKAGSHIGYDCVTLTCGQTRNRIDLRLKGRGASAEMYGAVIADKQQRVDNNLMVEHLTEGCTSDMLYKYVLDGNSVGAFAGKVYVAPGAQKTSAHQSNANLCVSPDARIFSQPMLEIYADDVKCNHGSSTGKMDDAALFYMLQRGIPLKEARLLLQHAFVNEVLRHVEVEHLHDRLSRLVEMRFRGELRPCKGCRGCAKD